MKEYVSVYVRSVRTYTRIRTRFVTIARSTALDLSSLKKKYSAAKETRYANVFLLFSPTDRKGKTKGRVRNETRNKLRADWTRKAGKRCEENFQIAVGLTLNEK